MINIYICDDNAVYLRYVHDFIENYAKDRPFRITDCGSADELLAAVEAQPAGIAVLDISLGLDKGIELAKAINASCPGCQVIFLTAYSEYASEAYFAEHTWYILKKDMAKYLAAALDKCLGTLENGVYEAPAIWVRQRRNMERVPLSEILYLERAGHQTKVVRLHGTMVCRQSPEELISGLDAAAFIHCHQSFWVNSSKIFSLVGDSFHLIDGSEVFISRSRKNEAARLFEEAVARKKTRPK